MPSTLGHRRSRCAKAVEIASEGRRLRVDEARGTIRQRIGADGYPRPVNQVRGPFHDDLNIGSARHPKSKRSVRHTEARVGR